MQTSLGISQLSPHLYSSSYKQHKFQAKEFSSNLIWAVVVQRYVYAYVKTRQESNRVRRRLRTCNNRNAHVFVSLHKNVHCVFEYFVVQKQRGYILKHYTYNYINKNKKQKQIKKNACNLSFQFSHATNQQQHNELQLKRKRKRKIKTWFRKMRYHSNTLRNCHKSGISLQPILCCKHFSFFLSFLPFSLSSLSLSLSLSGGVWTKGVYK